MKKHILLSFLFVAAFTQLSIAEDQTITLKDGSQVKGELVGVSDGVYTIHNSTLGNINVKVSQVANIANGNPPAAQAPAANTQPATSNNDEFNQKIQTAQTKLMNDPVMIRQLQTMAQDPELMKLLSDPELVRAVTSHDVKAIESNPRAQALMENPKMRALLEQMKDSGKY